MTSLRAGRSSSVTPAIRKVTVFIRSMRFWGTQLVSFPLLYQIKQFWPDCEITVVGTDPLHRHYESLPWVRRFVDARNFWDMLNTVESDTDLMVALHFASERYGAIGLIKRPRYRLGFENRRITDFIWTHRHSKSWAEYMGLSNLRLLDSFVPFDPESAARGCVNSLASPVSEELPAGLILMLPGGGDGPYKRWPVESFLALCDELKARMPGDHEFGFIIGPDEKDEANILKNLGRPDIHIFENRPIGDLCRLMHGAKLIVANDCGPSHLAQFACVPYVTVLHEPNPEWFWDRAYSAFVIPADGSNEIRNVKVDDVTQACLKVLLAKDNQRAAAQS